ncbi:hypothetical protein [uncultured Muribaculum sp.]|uniref:5-methylcytosine restriction system specificity protein McrC n=1 Tax=uncultured Muribaculum sp. TaxID=1918613 RepID=UPI002603407B|nr:hypothetical protein [uncultured Muribaculum sp.]
MKVLNLKDNTTYSSERTSHSKDIGDISDYLVLDRIANCDISDLMDENNNSLLVYPNSFGECDDRIGSQKLFTLQKICWDKGRCVKATLSTGNVAGFIKFDGMHVTIHSRFSHSDDEDFFLHYMLEKVLGVNLFSLTYGVTDDPVFDYLLCMFPKLLSEALRQGIYKEYQRHEYNDSNIRGTVNINRHLKYNIPFNGSISYSVREFSYDNMVTELIRHTIEYICSKKIGKALLESSPQIMTDVRQIISVTPRYNKFDRERIVRGNLKMITHPYFVKYASLQKLCLRILRGDKVKYKSRENEIYGILFDVSYLWEEYLAEHLMRHGFLHPDNRKQKGRIYLTSKNDFPRYPDYYRDANRTVIDAKYKKEMDPRNDVNQMITYMYRLKSLHGILLHPSTGSSCIRDTYQLLGYGASEKADLSTIHFHVPQSADNYRSFKSQMVAEEKTMIDNINMVTNKNWF